MNGTFFSKFNIYEQIGFLMVGAIAILVIVFDLFYFYQFNVPSLDLNFIIVWLIVAYFLGHFIQGLANIINEIPLLKILIRENKEDFNKQQKEITEQARKYFQLDEQDDSRIWNVCNMVTIAKDITGQVQSFNACYSLYRGWFVIFLLESIFLFYFLLNSFDVLNLNFFIFSIFSTIIFYKRSKRFWRYLRNKVLDTFIVIKTLKL